MKRKKKKKNSPGQASEVSSDPPGGTRLRDKQWAREQRARSPLPGAGRALSRSQSPRLLRVSPPSSASGGTLSSPARRNCESGLSSLGPALWLHLGAPLALGNLLKTLKVTVCILTAQNATQSENQSLRGFKENMARSKNTFK